MTKTRSFSIYLLKEAHDATNSLKDEHALEDDVEAEGLPENATLFVLDSKPRPPWWKVYFGIGKNLSQVIKGAVVFLPVNKRCFALCFGHVAHNLVDTSYEYDFGLRATLNSIDPRKLKSTDTLDPGAAKRQRTQLPVESELTLFDFDRDSTVLRSLTGKVRDEHSDLFRHITGSAGNLRVSTQVTADELVELCKKLLTLYESEAYKTAFPEIQNIVPVRDPAQIEMLNAQLVKAFQERDPGLNITVPEIVNYHDNLFVAFSGAGTSLVYDDVYIGRYYDYLEGRGIALSEIGIEDMRRHMLVLTDEDGVPRDEYTVFKSLVFDTTLKDSQGETFHLCEGHWYRIDDAYITRLADYLDPLCAVSDLPPYNHASEGEFNESVAAGDPAFACLDTLSISPAGQSAIEPCDLLCARSDVAVFYHVKVSTLSAQLSHLFNQGVNAIELLRLEPQAVERLEALIRDRMAAASADELIALIKDRHYRVVFGVVTRKEPALLSSNLPLFSRISLLRAMKALKLMDVQGHVMFVADTAAIANGRKKKRKKKDTNDTPHAAPSEAVESETV